MNNNLYISDAGIIASTGRGMDSFSKALKTEDIGLNHEEALLNGKKTVCGIIKGQLPQIPSKTSEHDCRNNRIALAALEEIRDSVDDVVKKYGMNRVGVVLGTSTSGVAAFERAVESIKENGIIEDEDYDYAQSELGGLSECVANIINVEGPTYTVSTACSSGAKALISAELLIQTGICDAVITGGVDSLCKLTVNGFNSLEVLSEERVNPFSKNRCGINIGEAGVLFIMEREGTGIRMISGGESSDAYHMSSPDPEGRGAFKAMQGALSAANLSPSDIGYISLHGTGTVHNDSAEGKAVNSLFGERVPCSSIKPKIAHTLGAAGASGIAVCWSLLNEEDPQLPLHLFDGEYDPEIPQLNLVKKGDVLEKGKYVMANAFAFGGNNCSVILGKDKD